MEGSLRVENLVRAAVHGINAYFEKMVVAGLKLKGFEFSSKTELHEFIKNRCTCTSTLYKDTYTVDGEAFLTSSRELVPEVNHTADGVTFTARVNYQYPTK